MLLSWLKLNRNCDQGENTSQLNTGDLGDLSYELLQFTWKYRWTYETFYIYWTLCFILMVTDMPGHLSEVVSRNFLRKKNESKYWAHDKESGKEEWVISSCLCFPQSLWQRLIFTSQSNNTGTPKAQSAKPPGCFTIWHSSSWQSCMPSFNFQEIRQHLTLWVSGFRFLHQCLIFLNKSSLMNSATSSWWQLCLWEYQTGCSVKIHTQFNESHATKFKNVLNTTYNEKNEKTFILEAKTIWFTSNPAEHSRWFLILEAKQDCAKCVCV